VEQVVAQKYAHVISHSHRDREWYMPYEKHRVRLIELMDTLIDVFEKDPKIQSFHLDGQTIVLEDYLQIRPEITCNRKLQKGADHIGISY
jgi:alpha-mannosidase